MSLPARVRVVEVGPRDGLQNEAAALTVDDRVALLPTRSSTAGLPVVEVGAFVSPKWVPQMAGSDEVFRRDREARRARGRPCWCPTARASSAPATAGAREIAVFTAASETFNRKNINASIDESFARFAEFVPEARREGMWVRGYVSTCFGCPYEGKVAPAKVVEVARRLVGGGLRRGLDRRHDRRRRADAGDATSMGRLRDALGAAALAVHFHDTRGTALANVLAALQEGIAIVDSSAGGLGGCPYAPGASGNLATEDLLYMLHGMGIETGVDLDEGRRGLAGAGAEARATPCRAAICKPDLLAPSGLLGASVRRSRSRTKKAVEHVGSVSRQRSQGDVEEGRMRLRAMSRGTRTLRMPARRGWSRFGSCVLPPSRSLRSRCRG